MNGYLYGLSPRALLALDPRERDAIMAAAAEEMAGLYEDPELVTEAFGDEDLWDEPGVDEE